MTRRPLVNIVIPVDVRDVSDDQLFDRLHAVAFSFGEMNRAIGFDRAAGKLDLEAWHDRSVPACYRARVAEIALMTFERFRGLKYTEELRHAFIRALRADVFKHLEPLAPPTLRNSHDEPPT